MFKLFKKENEYVRYLLNEGYWLKETVQNEIEKWENEGGEALEQQKTYWSGNYNSLKHWMTFIDNDIKLLEQNLYNKNIKPGEFNHNPRMMNEENILFKHEHDTKMSEDGFVKTPGARMWINFADELYNYCKNHHVKNDVLEYYKLDRMAPINFGRYGKWNSQDLWILKVESVELCHKIYEAKKENTDERYKAKIWDDIYGSTYRQRLLDNLHLQAIIENVVKDSNLNKTNKQKLSAALHKECKDTMKVDVELVQENNKWFVKINETVVSGYVKQDTALKLFEECKNIVKKF